MRDDSDADGNNGSDCGTVARKGRTLSGIVARAFIVWGILICAEILHGIARGIVLVPHFVWVSIATVLQLSITWMNWKA